MCNDTIAHDVGSISASSGTVTINVHPNRPSWDCVYEEYIKEIYNDQYFKDILGNNYNADNASAVRTSVALLASKMMRKRVNENVGKPQKTHTIKAGLQWANNKIITSVNELKKWLEHPDIWNKPTTKAEGENKITSQQSLDDFMMFKIGSQKGIFIAFVTKNGVKRSYATLWRYSNVIHGRELLNIAPNETFSAEIYFWELPAVKNPTVTDVYFAQKHVAIDDNERITKIDFERIKSSVLGKTVYLIVETKNIPKNAKTITVSIIKQTNRQSIIAKINKDIGDFSDLKNNKGSLDDYGDILTRDHANKVIIKLPLLYHGSNIINAAHPDREYIKTSNYQFREFDNWAEKIKNRQGKSYLEVAVKTKTHVYFGEDTSKSSNIALFLHENGDDRFDVINKSFYEIYHKANNYNFLPNNKTVAKLENKHATDVIYYYYDKYDNEHDSETFAKSVLKSNLQAQTKMWRSKNVFVTIDSVMDAIKPNSLSVADIIGAVTDNNSNIWTGASGQALGNIHRENMARLLYNNLARNKRLEAWIWKHLEKKLILRNINSTSASGEADFYFNSVYPFGVYININAEENSAATARRYVAYENTFHEFWHMIDFIVGTMINGGGGTNNISPYIIIRGDEANQKQFSYLYRDLILEAFIKDVQKKVKDIFNLLKEKDEMPIDTIKRINREYPRIDIRTGVKLHANRNRLENALFVLWKKYNFTTYLDIFDGMTSGYIGSHIYGYWKNTLTLYAEIFANLAAMKTANPVLMAGVRTTTMLAETCNVFEKMISDMFFILYYLER